MKIILRGLRIYGSASSYASAGPSMPSARVTELEKYPSPSERCAVYVREIPHDIQEMYQRRSAMSRTYLKVVHGNLTGHPIDPENQTRLFEEVLEDDRQDLFPSSHKWFLTLVLDREVDVEDDKIDSGALFWLEPEWAGRAAKEFRAHAIASFDVVAAYTMAVIDPIFLEEVVVDDKVTFLAPHYEPLGWPPVHLEAGAITVSTSRSALDIQRLETVLQAMASIPRQQHGWLRSLSYWYLRALGEPDPWKRFVWGFLALESMINQLWKRFYDSVVNNLNLIHRAHSRLEATDQAIAAIVWPKRRKDIDLTVGFSIVALALSPETASSDLDSFKRVNRFRNDLLHGKAIAVDQLPYPECRALLDHYMPLAAERLLNLDSSSPSAG